MLIIINLMVLIFSIITHELSHGYAALLCGDDTAKRAGRLTLNPIKHMELMGSFILPLSLLLIHAPFLFGWAKPVPINLQRMNNPKKDIFVVSIAGPLSNFILIVLGMLGLVVISKLLGGQDFHVYLHQSELVRWNLISSHNSMWIFFALEAALQLVVVNAILAVFNLIPIPPLDGSRLLIPFLNEAQEQAFYKVEKFGILIIFLLMYFNFFNPIFDFVLRIISKIIFLI